MYKMTSKILNDGIFDVNTLMMMGAVSGLMLYFGERNMIKIGGANIGIIGIMKLWRMGKQQTQNETKVPNSINNQVAQVFGNVNIPVKPHIPRLGGFGGFGL